MQRAQSDYFAGLATAFPGRVHRVVATTIDAPLAAVVEATPTDGLTSAMLDIVEARLSSHPPRHQAGTP